MQLTDIACLFQVMNSGIFWKIYLEVITLTKEGFECCIQLILLKTIGKKTDQTFESDINMCCQTGFFGNFKIKNTLICFYQLCNRMHTEYGVV